MTLSLIIKLEKSYHGRRIMKFNSSIIRYRLNPERTKTSFHELENNNATVFGCSVLNKQRNWMNWLVSKRRMREDELFNAFKVNRN